MTTEGVSAPPRVHEERFSVRSYEVEPDGTVRLVFLVRMMQEAAWHHADLLGKGFHHREEGSLFWVLSRLRARIDHYPRWGESFTIRTFPVGTEKLLAVREFVFLSADGDPIGRATSGWLVLDGGAGRPLRPQPIVSDLVVSRSEFDVGLDRVDVASESLVSRCELPVRRHDLDQYRHVNNASYLEWVLDATSPENTDSREVAEFAVDFLKETLLGDTYSVRFDDADEAFEVVRLADQAVSTRGRLRWRATGSNR